jgi:methyl-accepting chemotaxis protein
MIWFDNLKTQRKLFLSFGLLLSCLAITTACAVQTIGDLKKQSELLYSVDMTTSLEFMTLRNDINRMRVALLGMILQSQPAVREKLQAEIKAASSEASLLVDGFKNRFKDDATITAQLLALDQPFRQFCQTRDSELIPLILRNDLDGAKSLAFGIQAERFKAMRAISLELGENAVKTAQLHIEQSARQAEQAYLFFIAVGLSSTLIAIILIILIDKAIAKPLQEITAAAEILAEGELEVELKGGQRLDEVGQLSRSFQTLVSSLSSLSEGAYRVADGDLTRPVEPRSKKDRLGIAFSVMLKNMTEATTQLTDAVNVVGSVCHHTSSSVAQSAAGAAQTSSSVVETVATLEELRQTSQLSNEGAKQVSVSAQITAEVSVKGRQAIETTIERMIAGKMSQLRQKLNNAVEITSTVENIAHQSRVLAVNASIEAAKAGDQGKGFSVVAQEVERMANQSRLATIQIRKILDDIQTATDDTVKATDSGINAVAATTKQSDLASEAIAQLADSVMASTEATTKIADSSLQQVAGVDQVYIAMSGIKDASIQNIEAMKQVEDAAQELNALGIRLADLVGRYKI